MDVISSQKNDDIKYLKKLYDIRKRKQENRFILEGSRIIKEAIEAGVKIHKLFLTPDFKPKEIELNHFQDKIKYVKKDLLDEIADTVSPQGIIAIVDKSIIGFEDISNKDRLLVLDRIQDPGNMGTLIRTAVAAGMDGIIVLKGCVDIYNLKVLRATMGAIFQISILEKVDLKSFLNYYKTSKFKLVAGDISGKYLYNKINYDYPFMIVVGNEANGVCKDILRLSDYIVKIPILGQIESLNVAIAGGIIMYETVK